MFMCSYAVKETHTPQLAYSSMLPRSDTYRPSKNFRISLLRTLQICWMSAALWETSSRLCVDVSTVQ
jgi:hypothetical protein